MSKKGLEVGRRDFLKASGVTAVAAVTACMGVNNAPKAEAAFDLKKLFSSKNSEAGFIMDAENPTVQTSAGKIRGFNDHGVNTFLGIPYADADRFEEPHDPASWEGVKNCMAYGYACPQAPLVVKDNYILYQKMYWPMNENCQRLNVWSNDLTGLKPVVVWIHGGAYSTGYANVQCCTDGRNLCENGDVVVVSINHRLNCLGFLDLSEYGEKYRHSGNVGLLDIVAALQWVQNNIAQFGGDPNNVTLLGQSGGGCKIINLIAMPAAKGLFHKCIVQSFRKVGVKKDDAQYTAKLLFEELGVSEGDVESLKKVEYEKLRLAGDAALAKATAQGRAVGWFPAVDGDILPVDIWAEDALPEDTADVPMIIGACFAEMSSNALDFVNGKDYAKNSWGTEEIDARLTEAYGQKKEAVVTAFQKSYPNKPIVDALYVELEKFNHDAKHILKMREHFKNASYRYVFDYEFPMMGGLLPYHGAELPFVFGNVATNVITGDTKESHQLENTMVNAWSAFVHTGNPNHNGMVEWPSYTSAEGATMIFDKECRVSYHHDDELMAVVLG